MTYNIFVASDHHFSHAKILTFKKNDGTPLRDFASVEEMNEHMIEKHNSVVRPADKTYFLGDLTFHKRNLHLLDRMNGTKVLILGNHDQLGAAAYLPYFKDVRAVHPLEKGFVLTHVPLHPDCLERWGTNIHGHLHSNNVTQTFVDYVDIEGNEYWTTEPDTRYFCACVEQIDFTPIAFEEIKSIIALRNK